jgi:hypothetical protein
MTRSKPIALLPLAAAALLLAREITPKPTSDPAAEQARRILAQPLSRCTTDQRQALAQFYEACADLCPQLSAVVPNLTNAQFRTILETAARINWTGRFEPVPGLADAIHGPNGTIATLYTLDQGPFDPPKAAAALRATADACRPPSLLERILP